MLESNHVGQKRPLWILADQNQTFLAFLGVKSPWKRAQSSAARDLYDGAQETDS